MLIFNELPVIFPWFDKREKQARYQENVEKVCDYKLITPENGLLPFQFRRAAGSASLPISWVIKEINSAITVADVSKSLPAPIGSGLLRMKTVKDWDYFYYNGVRLVTASGNLVPLDEGFYESVITFSDGKIFYSEMFHVPAKAFEVDSVGYVDPATINYLKIEYWNSCDIDPILYNDLTDDAPFFKQIFYCDSFVTASEPELAVDGTKDGNDVVIPSFQRLSIKYRITELVADYIKIALGLLPMHSTVKLTTAKGVHTGDIERVSITSALEANGAFSTLDILFEQDLAVVQKECCANFADAVCPEGIAAPTITSITGSDAGPLTITGTASALGWVEIWQSTDNVTFTLNKIITRAQLIVGHAFTIPSGAYNYFKITNRNIACNFGTSAAFTF